MDNLDVLNKIKELTKKQLVPRPIGIDTLVLVLRVSEQKLLAMLRELEAEGHVTISNPVTQSRRGAGSGTVACHSLD